MVVNGLASIKKYVMTHLLSVESGRKWVSVGVKIRNM